MRLAFKTSLRGGRTVGARPTKNLIIYKDLSKISPSDDKKNTLEKIVDNKPTTDRLIEKVGRIKVKKEDAVEKLQKETKKYVQKLHRKPKKKITLEF